MSGVHGGELVARALECQGVQRVFSVCGIHVQPVYEGCAARSIDIVDTRHQQAAAFAADAQARLSGRPSVVVATAGPGLTNSVTALVNARHAEVPVVCIAGAPPVALAGRGALHEMDALGLLAQATKWSANVLDISRIEESVHNAFAVAQSGIPGPVLLQFPLDVLMQRAPPARSTSARSRPSRPAASAEQLRQVAGLLQEAQRPVLIVGSQLRWSQHADAVQAAAAQLNLPVFLNGMARGALPKDHPSLFSRSRKKALRESDLVLLLGTSLDFRVGYGLGSEWNPDGRLVHVHLDPAELCRNRPDALGILADCGEFLSQLSKLTASELDPRWNDQLRDLENRAEPAAVPEKGAPPCGQLVCEELATRLGPDDVLIADGGDFVATATRSIGLSDRQTWLDPGPFGALGVGCGYALAAGLERPEGRSVVLCGDGAFGLSALEFEALGRHRLNPVFIIGNDAAWGQVRRLQRQQGVEQPLGTELSYARYDHVVQALGGRGYWVDRYEDLGPALDGAFAADVPSCVNVRLGGG